jgi:anti-sigma factor RsiW
MNCNEISDKLSLYIDDELSSEEMKQVEEHLNSCENCQKVLDEYRNLISVLKNLPEEEPPEGYCERLHEKLLAILNTVSLSSVEDTIYRYSSSYQSRFWTPRLE